MRDRNIKIFTVVATVAGLLIGYLSLAATVDWPPFSDSGAPTVQVFKARNAEDQPNCKGSACNFIGVEVSGFEPDEMIRCVFDSSVGPSAFVDLRFRTDANGAFTSDSTNYFGNAGGWVSATCNGVRGDLSPW